MMLAVPAHHAGRPAPRGERGATLDGGMAWRRLLRLPSRSLARSRAGGAIRTSGDWTVLAKYCLVGASGYAVNLAVYLTLVRGAGLHYLIAAVCSFLVACGVRKSDRAVSAADVCWSADLLRTVTRP
jgi:hypothetical protein